jgi:hypothetical protein
VRYQHDTPDDVDRVRTGLRLLVDDVEPRGDALPRLLAAAHRRKSPRRPLIAASVVAVTATAVFLVALLVFPVGPPRGTEPVSVAPNSYLAQSQPGVIASFDLVSGRQLQEVGRVSGGGSGVGLAADGDRVYTVVARGTERDLVNVSPNGAQVPVAVLPSGGPSPALAAGAGRVAYAAGGAVVVRRGLDQQRIPVPPGLHVVDLALDSDGRLAVLTAPDPGGAAGIHVVEPGAASMTERPPIVLAGRCGPMAIAWVGHDVAALRPVDCTSGRVRVATLDRTSGEQIGAGVPFDAGPADGRVGLSADRLGRFLVSEGARQWLIDGSDVRTVPPACSPAGGCANEPGVFWG